MNKLITFLSTLAIVSTGVALTGLVYACDGFTDPEGSMTTLDTILGITLWIVLITGVVALRR